MNEYVFSYLENYFNDIKNQLKLTFFNKIFNIHVFYYGCPVLGFLKWTTIYWPTTGHPKRHRGVRARPRRARDRSSVDTPDTVVL